MQDGCCGSATPYCCPGGGCAATPSQCEATTLTACDGYDVPCGNGCAPSGSDCCDLAGHYCAPGTMCTSDTSCVLGDMATLALQVTPRTPPAAEPSGPNLSAPFADPPDASERSCDVSVGRQPHGFGGWAALLGAAILARRRAQRSSAFQSSASR